MIVIIEALTVGKAAVSAVRSFPGELRSSHVSEWMLTVLDGLYVISRPKQLPVSC